jgi:hypothetical protein
MSPSLSIIIPVLNEAGNLVREQLSASHKSWHAKRAGDCLFPSFVSEQEEIR